MPLSENNILKNEVQVKLLVAFHELNKSISQIWIHIVKQEYSLERTVNVQRNTITWKECSTYFRQHVFF